VVRVGGGFGTQLTRGSLLSVHKTHPAPLTLNVVDAGSRLRQCVQTPACAEGSQMMTVRGGACANTSCQPAQPAFTTEHQQRWTNDSKLALFISLGNVSRKVKMLKICATLHGKPIAELRSITCQMGSLSVTCRPTQVNAPGLNFTQSGRYSIFVS